MAKLCDTELYSSVEGNEESDTEFSKFNVDEYEFAVESNETETNEKWNNISKQMAENG